MRLDARVRLEHARHVWASELRAQSVSQLFHGPAPRSPLHRLAVRLRHSRSNTSTESSLPGGSTSSPSVRHATALRTRNPRYATGRRATRASGAECAPARRGVAIGYSSAAAPLRVTGLLPRPRFPAPRGGGAGPGRPDDARATGPGAAFGRFPVPFGGVAVPGDALPQSRQFHALPLGNFLIGFGFAGLAGRLAVAVPGAPRGTRVQLVSNGRSRCTHESSRTRESRHRLTDSDKPHR